MLNSLYRCLAENLQRRLITRQRNGQEQHAETKVTPIYFTQSILSRRHQSLERKKRSSLEASSSIVFDRMRRNVSTLLDSPGSHELATREEGASEWPGLHKYLGNLSHGVKHE